MSPNQLQRLLTQRHVPFTAAGGEELAVQCPRCSPLHNRRRPTLYVNLRSGKWICFRCEGHNAGADVKGFLKLFNLEHLAEGLDAYVASDDGSAAYYSRILGYPAEPPAPEPMALPSGFRRDWNVTLTGRAILRYLKSRLPLPALKRSGVGYVVGGKLAGCCVFPITLNGQLRSWQARRVVINQEPKYLNPASAEKGQLLYGYDWLRGDHCVLVEGIFDALNTPNSVALLGKTVSDTQVGLLIEKNLSSLEVKLDSDAWPTARALATKLARRLFMVPNITAARPPKGQDPATSREVVEIFTARK